MNLKKFFCRHVWAPVVDGNVIFNQCERCGVETARSKLPSTRVNPDESSQVDLGSIIDQIGELRGLIGDQTKSTQIQELQDIIKHQADCIDRLREQSDYVMDLVDRSVLPSLYNALNASQGNSPVIMNLIQVFETLKLSVKERV